MATHKYNPFAKSNDKQLVSDAMTLSMQSVVSVPSVGHRLIVKSYEVQVLRSQLSKYYKEIEKGDGKDFGGDATPA
ncbi:unnamed protein product [Prunus armeniaca]